MLKKRIEKKLDTLKDFFVFSPEKMLFDGTSIDYKLIMLCKSHIDECSTYCKIMQKHFEQYIHKFYTDVDMMLNDYPEAKYTQKELFKLDQQINKSELIRHTNMLFIENKEAENTLNLYLYDPHGSEPELFGQESNIFLEWLKTLYTTLYSGKTVNIIKRESFSCPIGIQGVIPELEMGKEGYCVTYSYFWLYIILHCSNSIPNVDLTTLISNIEKTVIRYIQDPRIFAEKIYSFAESIVSVAHDNIPNKQNYFKGLNDYMVSFIQEKMQHTPVEKLPYVDLIEDPYNLADSEEEDGETRYIDTSEKSRKGRKFGHANGVEEFAADFSDDEEEPEEEVEVEVEEPEEVVKEPHEVFAPEGGIPPPKRHRRFVYTV
jgi:hypothetical protein